MGIGLFALAVASRLRQKIIQDKEGKCADCGEYVGQRMEIHHKLPRSKGGNNNPENLIGLCGEEKNDCHEKWDREVLGPIHKSKKRKKIIW